MLDFSASTLQFRRDCILDFGPDTLDRMVVIIRCDDCDYSGESSSLIALAGFSFESMPKLRDAVTIILENESDVASCPSCDGEVNVIRACYLAYSATLERDFVAEFDAPKSPGGTWLMGGTFLEFEPLTDDDFGKTSASERSVVRSCERVSLADERLSQVYRESIVRAAASAAELGRNPQLAQEMLDDVEERFGRTPRALYLRSAIARDEGNFADALHTLEELVNDPREMQRALFEIGVVHFAALVTGEDRLVEAFSAFSQLLEMDDEHAQAHLFLGNIFLGLGELEDALSHFTTALSIEPDMMEAHFNAGIALSSVADWDAAVSHFELAHALNPNDADVATRLAESLGKSGREEEAKDIREVAQLLTKRAEKMGEALDKLVEGVALEPEWLLDQLEETKEEPEDE